jgi:hypothetical protein
MHNSFHDRSVWKRVLDSEFKIYTEKQLRYQLNVMVTTTAYVKADSMPPQLNIALKIGFLNWVPVTHVYNPSYLRG